MGFRWDDLAVLLAVHDHGSLAAAAGSLAVDASTVSRRLRAFETALGATLFDRTPDGLVPTELVRRLLPHAEAMAAAARGVEADAAGHEATPTGSVRVAVASGMAAYILAPRLHEVLDAYPGLTVDFVVSTGLVDLTRFEADLAVRFVRPVQGDLVYQRLGSSDGYGAFVSERYVDRYGLPDGRPRRWIGWSPRRAHLPEARLYEEVVGTPPQLASDDLVVMMQAWREGLGALLLPLGLGRLEPTAILLDDPPPVPFSLAVYLVTHRSLRDVPRVRAVRDWLASVLVRLDASSPEAG
ncbi:MAG: LysR family transcriptional regulator [Myxococcota bacterium]